MIDLYKILGVSKDADEAEIRKAYRRKAQQLHPDRDGGNHDAFQRLQLAYDVLTSPERKARYDATGETDQVDNDSAVRSEIVGLWAAVLKHVQDAGGELKHQNMVSMMLDTLQNTRKQFEKVRKENEDKANTYRGAAKRFHRKDEGINYLSLSLEAEAAKYDQKNAAIDERLIMFDRIREEIERYEFEFEPLPTPTSTPTTFVTFVTPS